MAEPRQQSTVVWPRWPSGPCVHSKPFPLEADCSLPCGSVFPVIVSPSLNVFFAPFDPLEVWRLMHWVCTWEGTHQYLEAVNHPDRYFTKEDILSSQQAGQHSLKTGRHSTVFHGPVSCFLRIMHLKDQVRGTWVCINFDNETDLYSQLVTWIC